MDAAQFEQLYLSSVRDVLRFVRRRTTEDPENLVAEVYTIAWRRRLELPAPRLRRAWLFAVAHNLLHADRRRRERYRATLNELARPVPEVDLLEDVTRERVVASAVQRLPTGQREVLMLTSWEGLSHAEVAIVLGIRPATARVRLHRARRALASDEAVRLLVEPGPDREGDEESARRPA